MDNDKHIKTKSSLYNMKLYCNKIPKENEYYTYWSVTVLYFIFVNSHKEY